MELPKEQFDYQKTLADIGVQISKGRAELADIDLQKEEYFKKRETEALARVNAILELSKDVLAEATANSDLLEAWAKELRVFATEVAEWKFKLATQQQEFEAKTATAWKEIGEKTTALEKLAENLRIQKANIEQGRKQNDIRNLELNATEKQINDRYATLLRTEKQIHGT